MQYLEGEDLKQKLRKAPLDIDLTLSICIQIATALEKAHAQGIIHQAYRHSSGHGSAAADGSSCRRCSKTRRPGIEGHGAGNAGA